MSFVHIQKLSMHAVSHNKYEYNVLITCSPI